MRGLVIHGSGDEDYWNQWSYLLQHSAPDEVYIYGPGVVPSFKIVRDATRIASLDELPAGPATVLADSAAPGSLMAFAHPVDAYYVFGPDHLNEDWAGFAFDHSVYIPPVDSINLLFSYEAAAMIGYDRGLKEYQAAQP